MQLNHSTAQLPPHLNNAQLFQGFCEVFQDVFTEVELRASEAHFAASVTAMNFDDVAVACTSGTVSGSLFGGARAKPDAGVVRMTRRMPDGPP